MDTIGPMTRTVEDCAIMLQAIAGHDPLDATSSYEPVPDYAASLNEGVRGLRIVTPREMFDYDGLDGETSSAVTKAIAVLEELGADTSLGEDLGRSFRRILNDRENDGRGRPRWFDRHLKGWFSSRTI